jgi:hypothetical protein
VKARFLAQEDTKKIIADARKAALLSAFEEVYLKAAKAVLKAKDPATVEKTIIVKREVLLPAAIAAGDKFYECVSYSFKADHVTPDGYGGSPSALAGISVSDHARYVDLETLEITTDIPGSKAGRSVPHLIKLENEEGSFTCSLTGRPAVLKISFVRDKARSRSKATSKPRARFINLDKPLPSKIILQLAQDLIFVKMKKPFAGKLIRKVDVPDFHFHPLAFTDTETRHPGQPRGTEIFDAYFAFCEGAEQIKVKVGIPGSRSSKVETVQFVIRK